MTEQAWLIPALPAVATAIIVFFGKRMRGGGAEIGIAAVGVSLVLAILVAIDVFSANVGAAREAGAGASAFLTERAVELTPLGADRILELGMRIDGLTAMMFVLVTVVSLMVQVYSTGYMHGDSRYTWYFALLSLFTASMLLLVTTHNLLVLLVGWELVGICSFLLIGFWWEEKKNQDAAIKAFLTTKLGDVGIVVGVATLWAMFGTFNIGAIIEAVEAGVQGGGAALNTGLLTFAVLALFLGAVGKSAQFPLHTWLPDAMAGPTPVSALIHAATMVTAGVFLVARLFPVYSAAPVAKTVIAVIGGITLLIAGLLALVQDDVKRVLAFSTISQLGYMVAALAFSYTAGIFHLFTHGFFKALLFLGAGSLIHAAHSNNMSEMGGLARSMPVTFWTFLAGSLALIAIPPLAGFWSKDEILHEALHAGSATGMFVFVLGLVGGLITAFYMTRVLYLVFAGQYRGAGHPHESPARMTVPLVVLAVPSVLIGLVNLPFEFAQPSAFSAWTMFSLEYWVEHAVEFDLPVAAVATAAGLIGVLAARAIYRTAPVGAQDPLLRLGRVTALLENGYYLDRLYNDGIVRTLRDRIAPALYWIDQQVIDRIVYLVGAGMTGLGRGTYRYADQRGIDGAVNGLGLSTNWTGGLVKFAQSGNVQLYAGAMIVGVIVLGALFALAA